MLSIYIQTKSLDNHKPLSIKNDATVSVPDIFIKCQMQVLRGDIDWQIKDDAGLKDFDAMVRLNTAKVDADLESLKKVEVHPNLVLPLKTDNELRFKYDDLSGDEQSTILGLEEKIRKRILKKYPKAECSVLVEVGDDRDGHKKNRVWLTFLNEKMQSPFLLNYSSANEDKLVERAVEKINGIKPKKVFITRDVHDNDGLKIALSSNKFKITGAALTEYKAVAIKKLAVVDWLFFSNIRSVKYFFIQKPDIGKAKIGAISKQVADEIRKYGKRAAFIGGSDASMVGKQFSNVAGGTRILFPKGRTDGRTVQMQVRGQGNIDHVIYETLKLGDHKIPKNDILIFTSPVNVLTYLENHQIADEKVIAYGDATMKTLKAKGVYSVYPTYSFDNIGIARAIYSASI